MVLKDQLIIVIQTHHQLVSLKERGEGGRGGGRIEEGRRRKRGEEGRRGERMRRRKGGEDKEE